MSYRKVDHDRFIRVWNRSSSTAEVAQVFKIKQRSASKMASRLRSKGHWLKRMAPGPIIQPPPMQVGSRVRRADRIGLVVATGVQVQWSDGRMAWYPHRDVVEIKGAK